MPYSVSLEEAENILRTLAEYHYFLDNPTPWWTAADVATGLGIGETIVKNWCSDQSIIGAAKYPGAAGWRIPRSSLLRFLAQRYLETQGQSRQA